MTNIIATGVGNADVEQMFGGILTVTSFTPTQFVLTNGFITLTVNGAGFTYDGTSGLTGGTITSVDEVYTNGSGNSQHWTGFSIPATSVISGLQIDLNNFHNLFFGGNDTFTFKPGGNGFVFSTGISGYGGDDIINYDAVSLTGSPGFATFIDGGAGNDTLNLDVGFTGDVATLTGFSDSNLNIINIETVRLAAGHDYTLIAPSTFAAAGTTVTVDGSALGAANKFNFVGTDIQGNLILKGGAGDDLLEGGSGNDIYNGGSGSDTVRLQVGHPGSGSGIPGVTVDLNLTAPQTIGTGRGSDTFISIENLIGTQYDDHLIGNAADNILDGGFDGRDILDGGAGNDTAAFGHLSAGQGVAVSLAVSGTQYTGSQNIQLISIENLAGTNYDDTLTGNAGDNVLTGNAGNDTLRGAGGTNKLDGGSGTDTAAFALAPINYYITPGANGSFLVRGPGETDTLLNMERASFDGSGQTLSFTQFMAQEFDPLSYVASYADLIQGIRTNQSAAIDHYMTAGYNEGRSITFNPLFYVASYGDLIRGFGANQPAAAASHYIASGFYEGRTVTFNALQYTASYSDLMRAFGTNQTAAATHYIQYGYAEGRRATFNALQYVASYSDLIAGLGDNQNAAYSHYIQYGYAEGRRATFNALQYIASYGDLIQSLGDNQNAAYEQYIVTGSQQGRTASFNALQYVASYADLIRGLGDNQTAAYEHYIKYGFNEGRTATFNALAYTASYADLMHGIGDNPTAAYEHYIKYGNAEGRTVTFDPVAYLLSYSDLQNAGLTAQTAAAHYIDAGFQEGRSASGAFGTEQTQHALTLGTQIADSLTSGDKDWFSIDLTAGHIYDLSLSGLSGGVTGGLADPFLELRNSHGVLVAQDNDSGPGADALIHLTAAATGTYYLVASSNTPGATGNYKILAANG